LKNPIYSYEKVDFISRWGIRGDLTGFWRAWHLEKKGLKRMFGIELGGDFGCLREAIWRIWVREKLGLIGFVFPEPEGVVYFHNPLLKKKLCSFEHPANWLCFGFVLGSYWVCFGFVFHCPKACGISVNLFYMKG